MVIYKVVKKFWLGWRVWWLGGKTVELTMGKSQSRQQQDSGYGSNHCLEYNEDSGNNSWYVVSHFGNNSNPYWVYDGNRDPEEEYSLEEQQGYEDNLVMVAPLVVEEAVVCEGIEDPEELDSIPVAHLS